jgi:hypothetical protein
MFDERSEPLLLLPRVASADMFGSSTVAFSVVKTEPAENQ